ncbi:hypothetical protein LCGC14_2660990, partial [marine sediment metagenome]
AGDSPDAVMFIADENKITANEYRDIFWIDGVDSWHGTINHQWKWPYLDMTQVEISEKGVFMEPDFEDEWAPVFANLQVSYIGNVEILRVIYEGEELTLDYGIEYWQTKLEPIKPTWDLRKIDDPLAEKHLLDLFDTDPVLKELFQASTVLSNLFIN